MAPSTRAGNSPTIPVNEMTDMLSIFKFFKESSPDIDDAILMDMSKTQFESNVKLQNQHSSEPERKPNNEIFPRDILKQFETMPKLHRENWHSWVIDFEAAVESVPTAHEILLGDFHEEHPGYDAELDARLIGTLRSVIEREKTLNIRYIIDKQRWTGGRQLFREIKQELTRNDKIVASQCLLDMGKLKMVGNDIERVIYQARAIANKGTQVGSPFTDGHLVTALHNCSGYSDVYKSVWQQIEIAGQLGDFNIVTTALLARWRQAQHEPLSREPRAAALLTAESSKQPARTPLSNVEANAAHVDPSGHTAAYYFGKRDENQPDQPAKCYNCFEPGHISKQCPIPKCCKCGKPGHASKFCRSGTKTDAPSNSVTAQTATAQKSVESK